MRLERVGYIPVHLFQICHYCTKYSVEGGHEIVLFAKCFARFNLLFWDIFTFLRKNSPCQTVLRKLVNVLKVISGENKTSICFLNVYTVVGSWFLLFSTSFINYEVFKHNIHSNSFIPVFSVFREIYHLIAVLPSALLMMDISILKELEFFLFFLHSDPQYYYN